MKLPKHDYMCEYEPSCFGGHYRCTGEAAWVYPNYPKYQDVPPYAVGAPFFCCADHAPFVKRPRISIQEYMIQEIMDI